MGAGGSGGEGGEPSLTRRVGDPSLALQAVMTMVLGDMNVPRILYGTAWKEERTRELTELALVQGFRGIDTANQRKHYHEAAVGEAIATIIDRGEVTREELFLQSKFTFRSGQDHRLPYDPHADIATQVRQSFASSLEHLRVDYLDSYVLHGPSQRRGLGADDWQAWRAMEGIQTGGQARCLGVSNVTLEHLDELYRGAVVKPRFVQNRCYAERGWDQAIRDYCAQKQIVYQGFSLLTANRSVLMDPQVIALAKRNGRTAAQVVFRFAVQVGMIALTGTSDTHHMREDLAVDEFELSPQEMQVMEGIGM